MVAAYQAAVREGIDPVAFWRLTPYQARIAMVGLRDGRTTLAWQIAALSRQKRLQNLEQLMTKKRKNVDTDLKAALMGFGNG